MRKIHRHTIIIGRALCGLLSALAGSAAYAQAGGPYYDQHGQPIFLPNTSSSYNQQGFNLPSVPNTHGQDIVRGSGGISCQSAIGSGGPQLDMGVIGTNDIFNRESAAVYGRLTVPLGKRAERVDCTKLYDLEIARLKMELKLMRAGAMGGMVDQKSASQIAMQASRGSMPPPKEVSPFKDNMKSDSSQPFVVGEPMESKPVKTAEIKTDKVASPEPQNVNLPSRNSVAHAFTPEQKLRAEMLKTMPAGTVKIANYGQPEGLSGFYAQIGAFSTIENAKKAWWKYTGKVPGDLVDYTAIAKPKRKGEKTLYLLQAGPFSKEMTQKVCKQIGNDCFPVRT